MIKEITLKIFPDRINDSEFIKNLAIRELKLPPELINAVQITRKSIDARSSRPIFQVNLTVYSGEPVDELYQPICYSPVKKDKNVIIVGSGPAGLFAALRLIELGIKPIILERGKNVRDRRFDLKNINLKNIVNPDSNYCFGEGGAGAYSDGKLYTRSTKRGDVKKILSILVQHGADIEILINAHPHLGSNKLPKIIESIRNTIINCGGEIHFNSRVTDLIIKNKRIYGVTTGSTEFIGDSVILATGHSARDIYYLLDKHKVLLEAKSFAMGVRVEHPQELINKIQYGKYFENENLPPATYSLACQVRNCGVYSFCMCPGGLLVPAATAQEELVLNGMSSSQRNLPFANAGIVVTIDENIYGKYKQHKHFAGLEYQKEIENKAFIAANNTQTAPAQRLTDFLCNKISKSLPKTSYIPGILSYDIQAVLGKHIYFNLKEGLKIFGKKMPDFITEEAKLIAVESRTSSPVRIPRNRETFMHVEIDGLFPAGEGAGYAGGIVSAAIDGENCANGAGMLDQF